MTPRTKEQFKAMRGQSRENILNAALELFIQKGYKDTTIQMIAAQADISKGLIYNYYDSKVAVLKAVMKRGFSKIESQLPSLDSIDDPKEKLRLHIEKSVANIKENAGYWKLHLQLLTHPTTRPIVQEETERFLFSIHKLCEDIFRQIGFLNPLTEVMIFEATVDGMINNYLLSGDAYRLNIVKNYLIEKYCPHPDNKGNIRK